MNFPERIDHFLGQQPSTHPTAFVAPGATVIGAVTLGEEASVWFNATVRADINAIRVGARTNIQDGAVIHVADAYAAQIGQLVTVGHQAVVHACTVDNEVLVGMGAIILDGAEIGARCSRRPNYQRQKDSTRFTGCGFTGPGGALAFSRRAKLH
jgi:carbonic anhydrase/acetyltransferase-like protein (isoleucine patch superfamily)